MKIPFKLGDLVCHKASKEPGIVIQLDEICQKHTQTEHMAKGVAAASGKLGVYADCEFKFTGHVWLSTNLHDKPIKVHTNILELIKDSPCN